MKQKPDLYNIYPDREVEPYGSGANDNCYRQMYENLIDPLIDDSMQKLINSIKDPNTGKLCGAMTTEELYISQDNVNLRSNAITIGAAIVRKDIVEPNCGYRDDEIDIIPCAIVNTRNEGFQHVELDADGNLKSMGRVAHACLVGGNKRPEALLVPLTEPQAVLDGITMLGGVYKEIINNLPEDYIPTGSSRLLHETIKQQSLPKAPFEEEKDDLKAADVFPTRFN